MNLLRHSRPFLFLLCSLLIVARISGAHWHLCYDGKEPPQSVHVGDAAIDDRTEVGHNDLNLNLVDSGLLKLFGHDGDFVATLTLFCLLLAFQPARQSQFIDYHSPAFPRADTWRMPPLRGPPR